MNIPEHLRKLAYMDVSSVSDRIHKIHEEAGEVSTEYLRLTGRKTRKRGVIDEDIKRHMAEEALDTIIAAMDLIVELGYDDETELATLMKEKLDKWEQTLTKTQK